MKKETQKEKIQRLEGLISSYKYGIEILQKRLAVQDELFSGSPLKDSMERDITCYKNAYESYKELYHNESARVEKKVQVIQELHKEIIRLNKILNDNNINPKREEH